jgi:hypothetical protein
MYGNKNLTERLAILGPKGQTIPNAKINIEHYLTESQFTELFFDRELTYKEITRLIEFPYDTSVFSRLVRGIGWKKTVGKPNKYNVDEGFFGKWSKQNAWVFGWLVTDGHIRDKYVDLTLQTADVDVLLKVKEMLSFDGVLYDHKTHKTLRVYNRNLVNSLYDLGIPSKDKTFNCVFPEIPSEFMWDFIRGTFEGDGSISVSKTHDLKVSVGGASPELMYGIQGFLASNGINARAVQGDNGFIMLHAQSLSDSLRWLYLMYKGTENIERLDRKFAKYISFINEGFYAKNRRSSEAKALVELALQTIAS